MKSVILVVATTMLLFGCASQQTTEDVDDGVGVYDTSDRGLGGGGSLKRFGKDLAVVVTGPVTIPLSAAYDSLDWGPGETSGPGNLLLFPVNFPLHTVKHFGYHMLYFGDIFIAPFYWLASITRRNDLEPIGLYSLTDGYPWRSAPVPYLEN